MYVKTSVCVGLRMSVCVCVSVCKHVSLRVSVFESLSTYHICMFVFSHLLYSIPCLSLATKTLTFSHLHILTSTHHEHIHMISNNILMNIFM